MGLKWWKSRREREMDQLIALLTPILETHKTQAEMFSKWLALMTPQEDPFSSTIRDRDEYEREVEALKERASKAEADLIASILSHD